MKMFATAWNTWKMNFWFDWNALNIKHMPHSRIKYFSKIYIWLAKKYTHYVPPVLGEVFSVQCFVSIIHHCLEAIGQLMMWMIHGLMSSSYQVWRSALGTVFPSYLGVPTGRSWGGTAPGHDTEEVTRAGRGGGTIIHRRPDQTCSAHWTLESFIGHVESLESKVGGCYKQILAVPPSSSQASVFPPGRRQTGDRRRKVVMLDEFDLEHGAGTCTRPGHQPSRSWKFYNHGEGPYLLKTATTSI